MAKLNATQIGSRITKYRVRNGWKQEELAAKINVPTTTICQYERGTSASIDLNVLTDMADCFGIPLNDLLYSQPNNGSYVDFVESTLYYIHDVEYDGKRYTIESSRDISPERIEESKYRMTMKDAEGNELGLDDEVRKVLGKALGERIKKIRSFKPVNGAKGESTLSYNQDLE